MTDIEKELEETDREKKRRAAQIKKNLRVLLPLKTKPLSTNGLSILSFKEII